MKVDVDLNLPPKKEILVFTPMTTTQQELYKHILHKTIHDKVLREKVCTTEFSRVEVTK